MYSVKPGRGPSAASGVMSIVFAVVAGVMAFLILASPFPGVIKFAFVIVPILFAVIGIGGAMYNFTNATSRNRMSAFDVTTSNEESDPIADALGYTVKLPDEKGPSETPQDARKIEGGFCPYCGTAVEGDFNFCPKCGKDI